MLVAALIVKRRLKMPRENISRQVGKMIKPEGEVPSVRFPCFILHTGISPEGGARALTLE